MPRSTNKTYTVEMTPRQMEIIHDALRAYALQMAKDHPDYEDAVTLSNLSNVNDPLVPPQFDCINEWMF